MALKTPADLSDAELAETIDRMRKEIVETSKLQNMRRAALAMALAEQDRRKQ